MSCYGLKTLGQKIPFKRFVKTPSISVIIDYRNLANSNAANQKLAYFNSVTHSSSGESVPAGYQLEDARFRDGIIATEVKKLTSYLAELTNNSTLSNSFTPAEFALCLFGLQVDTFLLLLLNNKMYILIN